MSLVVVVKLMLLVMVMVVVAVAGFVLWLGRGRHFLGGVSVGERARAGV